MAWETAPYQLVRWNPALVVAAARVSTRGEAREMLASEVLSAPATGRARVDVDAEASRVAASGARLSRTGEPSLVGLCGEAARWLCPSRFAA
jgi:hypothetical protein